MPLFWLALAFLAGILLADAISLPTLTWLLRAGAAFISRILLAFLRGWRACMLRSLSSKEKAFPP